MTENKKPDYYCSKCGLSVIVIPDQKPIKACACADASIIANMEASVIRNTGGVNV